MQVMDGILTMFPQLREEPVWVPRASKSSSVVIGEEDEDKPRGQEAVRQIMQSSPGKWWTLSGLVHEMARRDWPLSSDNAVRMAAERVVAGDPLHYFKDKGEKTGSTTYSYRPFAERSAPANGVSHNAFETPDVQAGGRSQFGAGVVWIADLTRTSGGCAP